jgi:hypothetical protein
MIQQRDMHSYTSEERTAHMETATIEKAVEMTREHWNFSHPDDLEKIATIFKVAIHEGYRAVDDQIRDYVLKGTPRNSIEHEMMSFVASRLTLIYDVVKATITPEAGGNEDFFRKKLVA